MAREWRRHMARGHTDAREGCHMVEGGWPLEGPWVSGPGYRIRAVTHLRYAAPPHILANPSYFLNVGLCFREVYSVQDTWWHRERQRQSQGIDRVDPSPRDH